MWHNSQKSLNKAYVEEKENIEQEKNKKCPHFLYF